jgi:hypothetical protein
MDQEASSGKRDREKPEPGKDALKTERHHPEGPCFFLGTSD